MHCPLSARQPETVVIAGSFDTDATTGAVTASTTAGKGYTVTKPAGTGIYRITFTSDGTRKYPRGIAAVASVEKALSYASVTSSVASNGYVEFTNTTSGAAANLDAGTVHFVIVVQNTAAGTI